MDEYEILDDDGRKWVAAPSEAVQPSLFPLSYSPNGKPIHRNQNLQETSGCG